MRLTFEDRLGSVRVEDGVIRGVRVLGPSSTNGRTYPSSVIQRAAPLYENVGVNVNHSVGGRQVSERIGVLKAAQASAGGLFADLHYLKTHAFAPQLAEAAQRLPESFGLSHVVEARFDEGSSSVVSSIDSVISVDLVADPATTKSLFESQQPAAEILSEVRRRAPMLDDDCASFVAGCEGKFRDGLLRAIEESNRPALQPIVLSSAPAAPAVKDDWPRDFVKAVR